AASGDRRDDGQLVTRLERRVEVREEADVLAVDEDVHEAPHLPGLVTDALLQARVTPLEIVHERGHRRPLRLDPPGAPRVPSVRARSRMPATISSSVTASPQPPDSRTAFKT